MEKHSATTVAEYLALQPPERRKILAALRSLIRKNVPAGYRETMQYGMISYIVPRTILAQTYNGQPLAYISLGAQKNYLVLHLMSVYGSEKNLRLLKEGFVKAKKKLDMGKACLRFRQLEDLDLPTIKRVIRSVSLRTYVTYYLSVHGPKGKPV